MQKQLQLSPVFDEEFNEEQRKYFSTVVQAVQISDQGPSENAEKEEEVTVQPEVAASVAEQSYRSQPVVKSTVRATRQPTTEDRGRSFMRSTKSKDAKSFKSREERTKYLRERLTKKEEAALAKTIDFGKPDEESEVHEPYKGDMSMFLQSGGRAEKSPRKNELGLNLSIATGNQSVVAPQTSRPRQRKSLAVEPRAVPATKRERTRTQKPRGSLPYELEIAYHGEKQTDQPQLSDRYAEYPKLNF